MTRTVILGFCFALSCFFAVSCAPESGPVGLTGLFPKTSDLSGVTGAEEYREFEGNNLFEYINGGAEVYLALGFSRVGARDYETSLGDGVYLTIEVYDMGNADDARTIFSKENDVGKGKGAGLSSAGVGEESALGGGSLAFHQGQFYVKVRCDDIGEDVDRLLKSAAGHLETKLKERS